MKNIISNNRSLSTAIIFICLTLFCAFAIENNNSLAKVEQVQGLYIFIKSKPVQEYEFKGKVNMPEMVWSGKAKEMVSIALRRCKKQYPNADAIIFQSEDMVQVDAIKFK